MAEYISKLMESGIESASCQINQSPATARILDLVIGLIMASLYEKVLNAQFFRFPRKHMPWYPKQKQGCLPLACRIIKDTSFKAMRQTLCVISLPACHWIDNGPVDSRSRGRLEVGPIAAAIC